MIRHIYTVYICLYCVVVRLLRVWYVAIQKVELYTFKGKKWQRLSLGHLSQSFFCCESFVGGIEEMLLLFNLTFFVVVITLTSSQLCLEAIDTVFANGKWLLQFEENLFFFLN